MNENDNVNYWCDLGSFIKNRITAPIKHPTFWIYFFIAVIGFGGFGIWLSIYQQLITSQAKWDMVLLSINTYFPAVAFASAFELIIPHHYRSYVKSLLFS